MEIESNQQNSLLPPHLQQRVVLLNRCNAALIFFVDFVIFASLIVMGSLYINASCSHPLALWLIVAGVIAFPCSIIGYLFKPASTPQRVCYVLSHSSNIVFILWLVVGCAWVYQTDSASCSNPLYLFSLVWISTALILTALSLIARTAQWCTAYSRQREHYKRQTDARAQAPPAQQQQQP